VKISRIKKWLAAALGSLIVVMLGSALVVRYWLWPSLAELLNDPVRLEQTVGPYLVAEGLRLEIRDARAEWSSWLAPRLSVGRVQLRPADGSTDLLLAESLAADFGLRSLLSLVYGVPIFSELRVSTLRVSADRGPGGAVQLAGFSLAQTDQAEAGAQSLRKALSLQGPWSIARADLAWHDSAEIPTVSGSLRLEGVRLLLSDDALSVQTQGLEAQELSALLGRAFRMPPLEGRLGPVKLQWLGAIEKSSSLTTEQWLSRLRLDASFSSLGLAPSAVRPKSPQISGLTGRLLFSSQQGSLALNSQEVTLQIPGHIPDGGLRLNELSGQVEFSAQDLVNNLLSGADPRSAAFTLALERFTARLGEFKLQGQGRYQYHGEGLGSLEANGSLGGLAPAELKGILPLSMGRDTRAWLVRSIQTGRPVNGSFRIAGPLDAFPFPEPSSGDFEVRLRLEDQTLAFSPDWPKITGAFLDLTFERQRLRIDSRQALIGSAPITQLSAEIADLGAQRPVLVIQGEIAGALSSMIDTVNRSPVRGWLDQALVSSIAQGPAELSLRLGIDLMNADRTTVQGRLLFKDNRVRIDSDIPEMTSVRGSLAFTEKGLADLAISGRALGGPFTATAAARSGDTSRVIVKGELAAGAVESWLRESASLPFSPGVFAGKAPYSLRVELGPSGVQVAGQSSLRGLAIRLPVPARKRSEEDWGLQFGLSQKADPQGRRQQSWKIATVSNQVSADLLRSSPISGGGSTVSGRFGIGAPVPTVQGTQRSGIVVAVQTESLDLSAWIHAFETRLAGAASGATGGGAALARLELDAQQVFLGEQQITGVQARAANQAGVWRIDLQSAQVSGQLAWTPKPAGATPTISTSSGTLVARLQRLWLPPGQSPDLAAPAGGSSTSASPSSRPPVSSSPMPVEDTPPARPLTALSESRRWPTIDLIAEDFRRGNKQFGRLVLDASPAIDQPRWDIRGLTIENPYGRLTAKGQWAGQPASGGQPTPASVLSSSRTQLELALEVRDGGGLLNRLGYPGLIRATPGNVTGQIRWAGAPTDFQVATMEGTLVLDMQNGQFLKADAGLAKLISVVNLQSLPKRITLDFRDIFSEGFTYERVRGSVGFSQGQARTENLRIVGIQASVFLEGQANLLNETQDLHVLVLPEFNAGLASLGYALVNPAVGLGSFIAQYLLRDPLRQALAYEYQITGRWDDPQVKALPRRTVTRENDANDAGGATRPLNPGR